MKNHLKDKKITIQHFTSTYVPGDGLVESWAPLHEGKLWAYYRQLSGKEIFTAAQALSVEEALFIINWRSDVSPKQRIVYNGSTYEITRIDDYEGYKGNLSVYAKKIDK